MRRAVLICRALLIGGLAAPGGLAFLCPSLAASAAELPLLRLRSQLRFQEVKFSLSGEDLFVTRTGTTAGDVTFLPLPVAFWMSSAGAGHASPSQLAGLNEALNAASAGIQRDCVITSFPGWSGTYEVSWYGQGGRRANTFVVSLQFPPAQLPECPTAIDDLLREAEKYGGEVLGFAPFSPFAQ